MARRMGWKFPPLPKADLSDASLKNRSPFHHPQGSKALLQHTLADLIHFIGALNYEKLISLPHPASRYEVERVIVGITYERTGVDIEEIKPSSRFTYDLGID
ncbi:hypothetical protein SAMN05421823_101428 [Catalinimonas alkaloidigena]|uniref:Uncharacterized protein n=2 Tax=Catalinimonas alkaloidigena TaxID=1075417 RepID=A0A1G8XQZ5_9BACT|nr:hypothetical protein SAMN05421823_101428 [Catalinimonas alkaloidigena]